MIFLKMLFGVGVVAITALAVLIIFMVIEAVKDIIEGWKND